jgi:hypothetical protein
MQENGNQIVGCQCANVYERDVDFGSPEVAEPTTCSHLKEALLSHRNDPADISHLSAKPELLALLDEFAGCFSNTPGALS